MNIVQKPGSHIPWRLVRDDGTDVTVPVKFDDPIKGPSTFYFPVSGASYEECRENALSLLGSLSEAPE